MEQARTPDLIEITFPPQIDEQVRSLAERVGIGIADVLLTADQLFLLRVDRNDRLRRAQGRLGLAVDVFELGIAVWMAGTLQRLAVALQAVPVSLSKTLTETWLIACRSSPVRAPVASGSCMSSAAGTADRL